MEIDLTLPQVAELLKLPEYTIRHHAKRGRLQGMGVLKRGRWAFPSSRLEEIRAAVCPATLHGVLNCSDLRELGLTSAQATYLLCHHPERRKEHTTTLREVWVIPDTPANREQIANLVTPTKRGRGRPRKGAA